MSQTITVKKGIYIAGVTVGCYSEMKLLNAFLLFLSEIFYTTKAPMNKRSNITDVGRIALK